MFCPYYKNREVFDGFNEMIEAFGGEPMTEEEFRSAELRNQRTGRNYSAMEAAYTVYDLNGGNFLDLAPNGEPSLLFLSLLSKNNNDRAKAIVQKANMYSKKYRDKYGDWCKFITRSDAAERLIDKLTNIVNSNTKYSALAKMILDNDALPYNLKYFKIDNNRDDIEGHSGLWNSLVNLIEVLANNVSEEEIDKTLLHELIHYNTEYLLIQYKNNKNNIPQKLRKNIEELYSIIEYAKKYITDNFDKDKFLEIKNRQNKNNGSRIFYAFDNQGDIEIDEFISEIFTNPGLQEVLNEIPYKETKQTIWSKIKEAIQSIFGISINKGSVLEEALKASTEFIKKDKEEYNSISIETDINGEPLLQDTSKRTLVINTKMFDRADLTTSFGEDAAARLLKGESVSSSQLLQNLINNGFISDYDQIASLLAKHDIPVKISRKLGYKVLSTTLTDKNGGSIILINPDLLGQVSNLYAATAIQHEIVHAVTVSAINKPSTKEEQRFLRLNHKLYSLFDKYYPKSTVTRYNVDDGLYALENEKEFAAVFITDSVARTTFYKLAKEIDQKKGESLLQTLKNFINSVSQLFVNKNIFNTTEELLKKYQSLFEDYLNNKPVIKEGNIISKSELFRVYKSISDDLCKNESVIDAMDIINKELGAIEQNNIKLLGREWSISKKEVVIHTWQDIINALEIRVNAIRSSNLDPKSKTLFINTTKSQIDMFTNKQVSKYIAITATLRQIIPQLLSDLNSLRELLESNAIMKSDDYMFLMHSNIGLYKNIASVLAEILGRDGEINTLIEQYNNNVSEKEKIDLNDIEELKSDISSLQSRAIVAETILNSLKNDIVINKLLNIGMATKSIEMQKYIKNLTSQTPVFDDDISALWANIGTMDSLENEALRALSYIVNKALDRAEEKSIVKNLELVQLYKNLKRGESQLDIYEKDERGRTTGWLLRKLNFGKFYKDYDDILIKINEGVSQMSGEMIKNDTRVAPNSSTVIKIDDFIKWVKDNNFDNELLKYLTKEKNNGVKEYSVKQAWNKMRNYWLYEHCERKYNRLYYEAWEKVSQITKDSIDQINGEIRSIIDQPGVIDDNGNYHYDVLSELDWNKLLKLFIQKKLLRSEYDIFGNKKTGSDLIVAQELKQLHHDLYGDEQKEIKKNTSAWLKIRNEIIELCGGKDAYEKWIAGEKKSGFKPKKLNEWDARNSRRIFKRDENGDAIVFKEIENAMRAMKVDYGKEYDELKKQEKELLKPYYSSSGEINAQELPETVKNLLIEIYSKLAAIRKSVLENNPKARELSLKYREVFNHYIKYVDTEFFKEIKRNLELLATDEDNNFDTALYEALLEDYGTFVGGWDNILDEEFIPYRWLQRMEAVDPKFMDYEPGDGWIEKTENQDLLNKNFDDSYNTSFVPKKQYYDNSKAYHKLEQFNSDGSINKQYSETLRALYDGVLLTMTEANAMQTNRLYVDNYLLPQMTGSFWKRERHLPWLKKWGIFTKWLKEHLGIGENVLANDIDVGSEQALDETDSEGNVTKKISISGHYPDNRAFNVIPQYYTRRLSDPSELSADLINIVGNYYRMSSAYQERLSVRDDCETIVDFLKEKKYMRGDREVEGYKSHTYETASKFLEMNLYDIRRKRGTINIGNTKLQWSKTASLWKRYTTAKNLGLNPKVAAVGFMTSMYSHIINSLTGQKYGKRNAAISFLDVLGHVSKNVFGLRLIGNPYSKDKMLLLMEEFNISSQARRKIEGINRNPIILSLYKHSVFGMLSNVDYLTKASIMISTLRSYRYVDGEFVTLDDIKMSKYLYSKEEYNKIKSSWKKAPQLYNLIKVKNGKLYIDDKYKESWNNLKFTIKNRAQKYAEAADGMATDLQKAAITQSWIGCFVLIHRQYLPLILQERFGKRVYDYDMQLYKNGQFRTLFSFVNEMMQTSIATGMLSGAGVGYMFGGVIGSIAGISYALYARNKGRKKAKINGEELKTVKEIFNEYFNLFKDAESNVKSLMNRYAIKQIFFEVLIYNAIIVPLVTWLCNMADDDDDKLVQMLAYWARAFQWESYTPYRSDDLMNTIKTPSAATSVTDAIEDYAVSFAKGITNTIFPQQNILFDPSLNWFDGDNANLLFGKKIKKGAYKNERPMEKFIQKLHPYHNLKEQLLDSKSKRKYLENQVMRIPSE